VRLEGLGKLKKNSMTCKKYFYVAKFDFQTAVACVADD
jgi:hypothetical protein